MSDTPEFRYATSGEGETAQAGIMDASAYLPADVPPHWQVYFAVEDADASVAPALTLGATLLEGPQDSGFGRVASSPTPPAPPSKSSPARHRRAAGPAGGAGREHHPQPDTGRGFCTGQYCL